MPAPAWTSTSWPCATYSRADDGVRPTRYSSGLISLGTPTRMAVLRIEDWMGGLLFDGASKFLLFSARPACIVARSCVRKAQNDESCGGARRYRQKAARATAKGGSRDQCRAGSGGQSFGIRLPPSRAGAGATRRDQPLRRGGGRARGRPAALGVRHCHPVLPVGTGSDRLRNRHLARARGGRVLPDDRRVGLSAQVGGARRR